MDKKDDLTIRKFDDSDAEDISRVHNLLYPDMKQSVESFRLGDENRADKCKHQRYVAELDGEVVGHGLYTQTEWNYQEGKFRIDIEIHPDYQGEGYGSKLYRHLMDELEEYDPVKLVCYAKEDKESSIRFLKDRGFESFMREWISMLDVDEFDPEEYAGLEEKLAEKDIVLTSLKELEHGEENKRKLYELHEELYEDVPTHDEYTGMDYDRYIESVFDRSEPFFEGIIIAVKDGEFIGMCRNILNQEDDSLFTWLTGVKREYREKGIATAMKVKAIKKAKEKGIPKIKTSNETGNEAIVNLNDELGFEKKPASISFKKESV
ncbi:MAG: GNAT family N-acetyltransferase [Candidatus Thermoplasmatota archaeon]